MSDDNEDHVYANVNGGLHSNNDNSCIPAVLEEGAVGGSGLLSLSMVRLVCISYKHSLPGILLACQVGVFGSDSVFAVVT